MEKGRVVVVTGGAGALAQRLSTVSLPTETRSSRSTTVWTSSRPCWEHGTPKTGSSLLKETFPKRTIRVALRMRSVSRLAE